MRARFGPMRSCIIALHLRSASVSRVAMTITNTSIRMSDVRSGRPAPANQELLGERPPSEQ